jgi:hypothetical protein
MEWWERSILEMEWVILLSLSKLTQSNCNISPHWLSVRRNEFRVDCVYEEIISALILHREKYLLVDAM